MDGRTDIRHMRIERPEDHYQIESILLRFNGSDDEEQDCHHMLSLFML